MNEFFSGIYEFLFYSPSFSQALYTEGLYSILGVVLVAFAALAFFLFYYAINISDFAKWYHWLLIALIKAAIDFLFSYFYPQGTLESLCYHYGSEYMSLAIVHTVLGFLFFIILSYAFRWWSTNCKYTPIPN